MKKLLVVLLTVALVFSLAAVASAAATTAYVGGSIYFAYRSNNTDSNNPIQFGPWATQNELHITGLVEDKDTGTWAKITWDAVTDSAAPALGWAGAGNAHYAAGVNNIADIFDIQFSTGSVNSTLIGQPALRGSIDGWYPDPIFCHRGDGMNQTTDGMLALKLHTDAFTANFEYVLNTGTTAPDGYTVDDHFINFSANYNFEGGKAYVGYTTYADYLVGAQFGIADGVTLAVDYHGDKDDTTQEIQGNVAIENANATLYYNVKGEYFGIGGEYNLSDKTRVGAKYFSTTDASYEAYLIQKYGVMEAKAGYADQGAGDGYFVAGVRIGLW